MTLTTTLVNMEPMVENIQRRASRFLCKTPGLSYTERLLKLNLLPVNYWLEYLKHRLSNDNYHLTVQNNMDRFVILAITSFVLIYCLLCCAMDIEDTFKKIQYFLIYPTFSF